MKKYRYLSIDDTVTINEGINLTFIAVAHKLAHLSYQVSLYSSNSYLVWYARYQY